MPTNLCAPRVTAAVLCAVLLLALFFLIAPTPAAAQSTTVVISQVYGGGGNSGSFYKNDFIEIFNLSGDPVSLNGWSVQYASAAGTSWQVTLLPDLQLQPGQFFLVQEAQGAGGSANLPTPDAIGTIPMSATDGKLRFQ